MNVTFIAALALVVGSGPVMPTNSVSKDRTVVAATGSMEPSIPVGSRLVVDLDYYGTHPVERFDVVLLGRSVAGVNVKPGSVEQVLCRVVGLPGERISVHGNEVLVNGLLLQQPFPVVPCAAADSGAHPCGDASELVVPENEYFLLADNRPASEDSRLWSPQTVKRRQILGKVLIDKS